MKTKKCCLRTRKERKGKRNEMNMEVRGVGMGEKRKKNIFKLNYFEKRSTFSNIFSNCLFFYL